MIRAYRFAFVLTGCLLLIVFSTASGDALTAARGFQMIRTGPGLSLHKEMFMFPATLSDEYNGEQTEAVFQISAKHRLFDLPVYFAYTQISFWQAFDADNSAPFRETNYNPELFYRSQTFHFLSGRTGADIGFEHESNGQRPPVSRSWNLLYFSPYYYRSNVLVYLKLRYRIPEDEKENPEDAIGDDNPDITDYLGHTDLDVFYRFPWGHLTHLRVRGFVGCGRGNVLLNYSIPVPRSDMSYFAVRVSHGYGESMVDYKLKLTRVGIGIMFSK